MSESASSPRCAWCGAPLGERAQRLRGRIRCPECGAATTDPWPDERTLSAAYAGWYRPAAGRFAGPGDRLLRRTRGQLARRLNQLAPPGTVLDVGSGDGALLDALHAGGRDAIGLERASTRPDVLTSELADLEGTFAAIVFWHSLEHLRDPAGALARSTELLRAGGILVVAIPNAASFQSRVFGDAWFALDIPRHLVHLTASALLGRLRVLGLRIERVSHVRGGQGVFGWLHGLVGRLPGRPDLYDAIRMPAAQRGHSSGAARLATLAAGASLLPAAIVLAAIEALMRRGGTVYVEARRPA